MDDSLPFGAKPGDTVRVLIEGIDEHGQGISSVDIRWHGHERKAANIMQRDILTALIAMVDGYDKTGEDPVKRATGA